MAKIVLGLVLLGCLALVHGDKLVGGMMEQDISDPAHVKKVNDVITKSGAIDLVKKLISVKTQVVAGTKYVVQYESANGKVCDISWVEQPWISQDPQYVQINCK